MKKILVCLVVMACLLGLSNVAFGTSGSAVINHYWSTTGGAYSHLNVSNITDSTISVKITLYLLDGTILYDSSTNQSSGYVKIDAGTILNYTEGDNTKTVSFDLAANQTCRFVVSGFTAYGYGIIEWTQNSKETKGLVASSTLVNTGSGISISVIPINNGLPF